MRRQDRGERRWAMTSRPRSAANASSADVSVGASQGGPNGAAVGQGRAERCPAEFELLSRDRVAELGAPTGRLREVPTVHEELGEAQVQAQVQVQVQRDLTRNTPERRGCPRCRGRTPGQSSPGSPPPRPRADE